MDKKHQKTKLILKIVGISLLVIGVAFTLWGIISFFMAFGTSEPPKFFWAAFIGLPLVGVGIFLTTFAFRKEITKFVKDESVGIYKETLQDVKPDLADVAQAMMNPNSNAAKPKIGCPYCGTYNDYDDKFCKKCGKSLRPNICPKCGEICDDDSEYCQKCGTKLPERK